MHELSFTMSFSSPPVSLVLTAIGIFLYPVAVASVPFEIAFILITIRPLIDAVAFPSPFLPVPVKLRSICIGNYSLPMPIPISKIAHIHVAILMKKAFPEGMIRLEITCVVIAVFEDQSSRPVEFIAGKLALVFFLSFQIRLFSMTMLRVLVEFPTINELRGDKTTLAMPLTRVEVPLIDETVSQHSSPPLQLVPFPLTAINTPID